MSKNSYKITAEEVREAAKKNNLSVDKGSYFGEKIVFGVNSSDTHSKIHCACPLGQLYIAKTNIPDSYEASQWAIRKYGRHFRDGFTNGFDGVKNSEADRQCEKLKKQRDRESYKAGLRNGRILRRYLLKNNNNESEI